MRLGAIHRPTPADVSHLAGVARLDLMTPPTSCDWTAKCPPDANALDNDTLSNCVECAAFRAIEYRRANAWGDTWRPTGDQAAALYRNWAAYDGTPATDVGTDIPASLDREAGARDAAVLRHTEEVNQQRARDAVEVPGLSKAALSTLDDVRDAIQSNRTQGDGERYAAQQQRQEAAVAGAWAAGRVDPNVAGELDRFMAAAGQRLGEAGKQVASRAAGRAGEMKLPGVGPEQQAGLDVLARSYKLGREGADHGAAHGQRVGREEKAAERERGRQEERQVRGLLPEPPREQQKQGRGFSR